MVAQGAPLKVQANALLRKSVTYQKRNVRSNICLLSAPIYFCLILLALKLVVNNVFLSGPDSTCGCQCLRCCNKGGGNCTLLEAGYCDEDKDLKCEEFDKNNCGIQFSDQDQSVYCGIDNPSIWPPVSQVPQLKYRAQPYKPAAAMMVASTGTITVPMMAPYFFPSAPVTRTEFLAVLSSLANNFTVNGYLLAQLGLQFGTDTEPDSSLYIERAFSGTDILYIMLPQNATTSCVALGLNNADGQEIYQFGQFMQLYINATSGTQLTAADVASALAGNPTLALLLQQRVTCVDAPVVAMSVDDLNEALYCGWRQARCNGSSVLNQYASAWDFGDTSSSQLNLGVYYNKSLSDNGQGPTGTLRLPETINLAARAWWQASTGQDPGSLSLQGVMSMPKLTSKLKLDFSTFLGPLFYSWVVQLLLPTFLQQLVYEKERRLRMMMKMHGLGDGAYWLITYLWYLILYIAYILVFLIFGGVIGLEVFRKTSFGVQAIFYLLFGNCMIGLAFLLSCFFSSARTAVVFANLYVFATGLVSELLLRPFMEKDRSFLFYLEWIPSWALYRGLWEQSEYSFLGSYRDQPGLTFPKLTDKGNGMRATWGIFAVEWLIFMVLAWYFEQVLSTGNGIRKPPLFFLDCLRRKKNPVVTVSRRTSLELTGYNSLNGTGDTKIAMPVGGEMADVAAERARVEQMTNFSNTPIVIKDLKKVYPGLDGGKPKVAVRTLTLGIERGECFGLLGPNGAGKSTSINMLTGFLEPSGGHAIIEGHDILTEMSSIYNIMGVCPQHDLLWEQLTGEEHLLFYGRLKGLKGKELTDAVESSLKAVNLFAGGVGRKQCGKYSGGMKRRLSVAISFIGRPQVVYLDEPSTGLDPASRRNLWDVVKSRKEGRSIILTTHSMEEAEVLCDRLGIFVDGQLVCVGNPKEITSRYAGYLVFTITVPKGNEEAAKAVVMAISPNARLTYGLGGTLKYELPTSEVTLSQVFTAMNVAKQQMTVLDWGVANATLEEVFIKFARSIGPDGKGDDSALYS